MFSIAYADISEKPELAGFRDTHFTKITPSRPTTCLPPISDWPPSPCYCSRRKVTPCRASNAPPPKPCSPPIAPPDRAPPKHGFTAATFAVGRPIPSVQKRSHLSGQSPPRRLAATRPSPSRLARNRPKPAFAERTHFPGQPTQKKTHYYIRSEPIGRHLRSPSGVRRQIVRRRPKPALRVGNPDKSVCFSGTFSRLR